MVKGREKAHPPNLAVDQLLPFQTLRRYTPGAMFECAQRMIRTKMIAWAFVDDKDLPITSKFGHLGEAKERQKVMETMERVLQAWERLLFASGGALTF